MRGIEGIAGKRVLVTGGAGVIGRQLLAQLADAGAQVLSADREPPSRGPWSDVPHVRLDLADADLTPLAEFRPQVFMHLAAAFERSKESPEFWPVNWHDNVLNSHRMVDLASGVAELETFVFASSYLVYDPALYLTPQRPEGPVTLRESSEKETRNVTGAAKLYSEAELAFMTEYLRPQVRVANARIFRVYGQGSKDVVSRWVRAALRGERVELYNGDNMFDYVYAGDIAQGLMRLAAMPGASGQINLSRGVSRRVRDVVTAIESHVPGFSGLVDDRGAIEDFEASQASLERLEAVLGWVPPTDLEQGVGLVVEHERAQMAETD